MERSNAYLNLNKLYRYTSTPPDSPAHFNKHIYQNRNMRNSGCSGNGSCHHIPITTIMLTMMIKNALIISQLSPIPPAKTRFGINALKHPQFILHGTLYLTGRYLKFSLQRYVNWYLRDVSDCVLSLFINDILHVPKAVVARQMPMKYTLAISLKVFTRQPHRLNVYVCN